jgi:hypothetical protein
MKYTITKGQLKEDVLVINGNQSVCPYAAPLSFAGQMGQVQIIRMPCSTVCPHASVTSEADYYETTCGSTMRRLPITKEEEQPKPTSKLVSL